MHDRAAREVHLSQSFGGMWFGRTTLDPISGDIVHTTLPLTFLILGIILILVGFLAVFLAGIVLAQPEARRWAAGQGPRGSSMVKVLP